MNLRTHTVGLVSLLGLMMTGCPPGPIGHDAQAEQLVAKLLLPSRIEIVEPFTRVKRFDDEANPNGIELLLRAVNYLDNPGLMIAGSVQIELYEYVPASADHKGNRLENWNVELLTAKQQRTHWNQLTQMYEFRLEIDPTRIPRSRKFYLSVTHNAPTGEHLIDECILRFDPDTISMGMRSAFSGN